MIPSNYANATRVLTARYALKRSEGMPHALGDLCTYRADARVTRFRSRPRHTAWPATGRAGGLATGRAGDFHALERLLCRRPDRLRRREYGLFERDAATCSLQFARTGA